MKSKKKMELPISTIDNPKNKNMHLVRANYNTNGHRRQIYDFELHRLDDCQRIRIQLACEDTGEMGG